MCDRRCATRRRNFRAACFLRAKSAVHRARHLLDMGHQDLTGLASLKVLVIGNFPERLGIRRQSCLGSEGVKRAFSCQFHRRLNSLSAPVFACFDRESIWRGCLRIRHTGGNCYGPQQLRGSRRLTDGALPPFPKSLGLDADQLLRRPGSSFGRRNWRSPQPRRNNVEAAHCVSSQCARRVRDGRRGRYTRVFNRRSCVPNRCGGQGNRETNSYRRLDHRTRH